jgi:tRNA-2-methylthio-N6-dimethylallyladenosine synthase
MPSYSILTFGCQMNVHDSDRMHEVLRGGGYVEATSVEQADVVVLNTCSVREKAEHKLRSEVGRLAPLKKLNGDLLLVVAGCVAQQEGEKLLKRMPSLDLVIGPDNIGELPGLLAEVSTGGLPAVRTVFDTETPRFLQADPASRGGAPASTFVTIMKGCDERCSFCVVPYTRGPERYRSSGEIVAEIGRLVEAGAAEITLLGQTVNSYRDPEGRLLPAEGADAADPDESEFAALLRRIAAEVPALGRLRYTSPHPRHLTRSLILAHRDLDVLAEHVHMPVQSGSDRMLKRMIRRYTRAEYVARVAALREARPGLTVSTDVIVGFPGETDEEAEATVGLIREVGFLGVFGFKYSQRPYTPALKLADDVSEAEKGRRLARVFEASEALLAAHLPTLVGSGQRVLIEGKSKTGEGMVTGRTRRNEIVHLRGAGELDLVGRQLDVVVTRANKHSVEAELAEGERARIEALGRRAPRAPGVGERATGTPRRSLPMAPRREQAAQARPAGGPGDTAVEG